MVYPLIPSFFLMISLCFHGSVITTSELDSEFARIKQWAFWLKESFNPDLKKQAQEAFFLEN